MPDERVIVVGAGMAGLMSALTLAHAGLDVVVCERASSPGGKMRTVGTDLGPIDCGPTVLTMVDVIDEMLRPLGFDLDRELSLTRLDVLARHWWDTDRSLDLYADVDRTAEAIAGFAGAIDADGYRRFAALGARIYETLQHSFIRATRTSVPGLVGRVGLRRLGALVEISPFESLWQALGRYFADPRLRQLFGRYATYAGSSPFTAPATLMLIAHVERQGVWSVQGGINALALQLAGAAERLGARIRYDAPVASIRSNGRAVSGVTLSTGEVIEADYIVFNGDVAALSAGLLGAGMRRVCAKARPGQRSLSALTFAGVTATAPAPLDRHNVIFSADYKAEFEALAMGEMPADPTIYICAQDRPQTTAARPEGERVFALINAPPRGDERPSAAWESGKWLTTIKTRLVQSGLSLDIAPNSLSMTTPTDFAQLYPGSGGAIYGRATQGWAASFQRPGANTHLRGLFLAGGSTHPGAGLPMAAIAGHLAAHAVMADQTSRRRSHRAATAGGMSTASAMMARWPSRSSRS